MFVKDQIDEWIKINDSGENYQNDDYFAKNYLKKKLVESKFLIDRWGNVVTDIIVHSSKKELFQQELQDSIYQAHKSLQNIMSMIHDKFVTDKKGFRDLLVNIENLPHDILDKLVKESENVTHHDCIWGAVIHYTDDCPTDKGIMVSRDPKTNGLSSLDSKSINVFPL